MNKCKPFVISACLNKTYHAGAESWELGDEVQQGEGHGEGAQQEVGDGQVGDEDIPCGYQDLNRNCFLNN